MQAGVDTIKPDSRVKEALSNLAISYRNDLEVVRTCEDLVSKLILRDHQINLIFNINNINIKTRCPPLVI